MRFMVDHMVIKLGKYLRILGFDADWDLRLRTHELITRANAEGRTFLTRNGRLASQYPAAQRLLVLADGDPVEQLRAVLAATGAAAEVRWFARCIRCNVPLEPVASREACQPRVHPNVFARHTRFETCPRCATIFWHGSHVRNTRAKLGALATTAAPRRGPPAGTPPATAPPPAVPGADTLTSCVKHQRNADPKFRRAWI